LVRVQSRLPNTKNKFSVDHDSRLQAAFLLCANRSRIRYAISEQCEIFVAVDVSQIPECDRGCPGKKFQDGGFENQQVHLQQNGKSGDVERDDRE
jgi:hypothetical protein